jgi:hypothetical protein
VLAKKKGKVVSIYPSIFFIDDDDDDMILQFLSFFLYCGQTPSFLFGWCFLWRLV